jgi:hypothetical protein
MAKAKSKPTTIDLLRQLETKLEKIFVGKAPALSESIKELIVKVSPWLIAISLILLSPVILGIFGISLAIMPVSFLGGVGSGFSYILGISFFLGMIVLELMALPGLFKRQERAWRLMFYSTLLSLTHNLINLDLGGLLLGGIISFYFLFQIKSKYTK